MNGNIIEVKFRCIQCGKHICKTQIMMDTQGGMPAFQPRKICLLSSALDHKSKWEPTVYR